MNLNPQDNAVALSAVIIGAVTAVLTFISAFNIYDFSDAQYQASLGLATALIAVGAWWTRRKVYAESTVHPDVGDTHELPPGFDA